MKKKLVIATLSILILGILALIPYLISQFPDNSNAIVQTECEPEEQYIEYGINCDSLHVEKRHCAQKPVIIGNSFFI